MIIQEQLAIEFAVYLLAVSCMVLSGLLGYFMAVWRTPWIVRASIVATVYSPLLLIGAAEIFLVFVAQILLIGWLISILRGAGKGSVGGREKLRLANRVSIGSLLCLTSVSAGAVVVWQALPTLNVTAWVSLLSCATATVSFSVCAWLLVNLSWRWYRRVALAIAITFAGAAIPACFDWFVISLYTDDVFWPPETTVISVFNSSVNFPGMEWYPMGTMVTIYLALVLLMVKLRERRRLFFAFSAVLMFLSALMPTWTLVKLLTPPKLVSLETDDNAYPAVMQLSKRISKLKISFQEYSGELVDLRELLKRPIAVPIDFTLANMPMDEMSDTRTVAMAIGSYGDTQIAAGKLDEARDAYLLNVFYGSRIRRGGLLIHMYVGGQCTDGGIEPLYRNRHGCSTKQAKDIVDELINLSEQLEPGEAFVERDQIWSIQQGWHAHIQHLMIYFAGAQPPNSRFYMPPTKRELTELRLLATEYAITRYLDEKGTLPEKLDDLIPAYLPKRLEDPFSADGQVFHYVLKDRDYILYSVGSNSVDDGGLGPGVDYSDITFGSCDLSLKHVSELRAHAASPVDAGELSESELEVGENMENAPILDANENL